MVREEMGVDEGDEKAGGEFTPPIDGLLCIG